MPPSSSPFVTHLEEGQFNRLKELLEECDFEFSQPAYTLFSGKKKGVSCTLYESGKLVVQGKEKREFIEFYLEPEILGHLQFTYPEAYIDTKPHMGSDEAGKGDFFGPLCVACCYADSQGIQKLLDLGVTDSKRLADAKAIRLSRQIAEITTVDVVTLSPVKYNELYEKFGNLNHLLAWAHTAAIGSVHKKTGCSQVLVDKFAHESVLERYVKGKKLVLELKQETKAESDLVVAAASICARAKFLKQLEALSSQFGMELPKGAGAGVERAAQQFANKHGREALRNVAKLHFRTYDSVSTP